MLQQRRQGIAVVDETVLPKVHEQVDDDAGRHMPRRIVSQEMRRIVGHGPVDVPAVDRQVWAGVDLHEEIQPRRGHAEAAAGLQHAQRLGQHASGVGVGQVLDEVFRIDVAERAGFDISTISRVSNSKYVQTNFGIYPLKYFFSESMQTDSGEEISTREVKKIMKEHIDAEDKRKPLTDEELASILKEKGYVIARRTVAKYREQLGLPVARLRKEI